MKLKLFEEFINESIIDDLSKLGFTDIKRLKNNYIPNNNKKPSASGETIWGLEDNRGYGFSFKNDGKMYWLMYDDIDGKMQYAAGNYR